MLICATSTSFFIGPWKFVRAGDEIPDHIKTTCCRCQTRSIIILLLLSFENEKNGRENSFLTTRCFFPLDRERGSCCAINNPTFLKSGKAYYKGTNVSYISYFRLWFYCCAIDPFILLLHNRGRLCTAEKRVMFAP